MSEYRFHLEKYRYGSKIDCPNCGRKRCFVRYIDEEGTVHFPSSVGKCDHEQSCGYHYTPREYFRDNSEAVSNNDRSIERIFHKSVIHTRPAPVEPSYIPDRIVRASLSHYDKNPLYRYLCGVFGTHYEFFPGDDAGLYAQGGTQLDVSRGLGPSRRLPLRICNAPELAVLTLVRGEI